MSRRNSNKITELGLGEREEEMKKLMFAVAAIAAGVAVADVTSANIVG